MPSQWGARMHTVCGDVQHAARKHVEALAKRQSGSDIIDLFPRACFIQGLHDDGIKTMVKAKGKVNTPLAQLVEVALEEESAIRSESIKRNIREKGRFGNQGTRYVPRKPNENKEVRVATVMCYRCKKQKHIARNYRKLPRVSLKTRLRRLGTFVTNGQGICLGNRRQNEPREVARMTKRNLQIHGLP